MKRQRELHQLRQKVATDRQRVEAMEARWLIPALAFLSGMFLPSMTGKRSGNPVTQSLAFIRTFFMRAFRFVLFRNLWEVLRKHDAADMVAHTREIARR